MSSIIKVFIVFKYVYLYILMLAYLLLSLIIWYCHRIFQRWISSVRFITCLKWIWLIIFVSKSVCTKPGWTGRHDLVIARILKLLKCYIRIPVLILICRIVIQYQLSWILILITAQKHQTYWNLVELLMLNFDFFWCWQSWLMKYCNWLFFFIHITFKLISIGLNFTISFPNLIIWFSLTTFLF